MIPPQFEYVRPPDLDAALAILRDREGEAKVLAGGYSLLPLLKLRLASPALLVDLRDVEGIDRISQTDEELRVGGRATHRKILEDPIVARYFPLFHDAAGGIGDPQIRNWGTIGGSCAHADPAADWPAVLIASNATIVVRSASAERTVPAREFFIDTFVTAIEPTEILTEIRVPRPPHGSGGAYQHLERRSGDFSTVGVGVQLRLDEAGTIADIGIGVTAVAPAAFAATHAEDLLRGAEPTDELIAQAGDAVAAQADPTTDGHGPAEYKRAMAREMTVRALRLALARARGQA